MGSSLSTLPTSKCEAPRKEDKATAPGTRSSDLYVVVLDESGSMGGTEGTTRTSLSAFHSAQQSISKPESPFKIFTFSNEVSLRFNSTLGAPLKYEYNPNGGTALHDAVGFAINDTKALIAKQEAGRRPEDVYIIIITDGAENSSRNFTGEQVRAMIDEQQKAHDWKFVFLAANQDAVTAGADLGISKEACLDFAQSEVEQRSAMTSVSAAIGRQKASKCSPSYSAAAKSEQISFLDTERMASKAY